MKKDLPPMKSMLHEASSIIKAIEKAWTDSGKPSEFTIKILEEGQKGFLGLTKFPAIVSITFTSTKSLDKSRFKERDFQAKKPRYEQQPQQPRQQERPRVQRADSQDFLNRQQAVKKAEPVKVSTQPPAEELQIWTPELAGFVSENLKDFLTVMQLQVGFNTKIDKKNLFIYLEKPIFDGTEENRIFLNAISYLLMQFLKRKHKKKFRGYQILMSSTASNESTNTGK
jgi:predicted RNA-binding protein Jag